jgi:hypothetical protein
MRVFYAEIGKDGLLTGKTSMRRDRFSIFMTYATSERDYFQHDLDLDQLEREEIARKEALYNGDDSVFADGRSIYSKN